MNGFHNAGRMMWRRAAGIHVVALMAVLVSGEATHADDDQYRLLNIKQAGAPMIVDKELIYTTDLVFSTAPEHFWIYYNARDSTLVMDIYGGRISIAKNISLGGNNIFSSVDTSNNETSMSLSGVQAKLLLKADPGWHFEASTVSRTVVQIKAWKTLAAPKPAAGAKTTRRVVFYIFSAAAASAVTFALIYFIGRVDN